MHLTAMSTGSAFFARYLPADRPGRILDVGGLDINGSLRGAAPQGFAYLSVDITAGPGVDLVLDDPYALPFENDAFDAVVSTSCFEHDSLFWLTFNEMCRVVRPGGHVYVNAPSNGKVHRHPVDCWRFYPDAGISLVEWARRSGFPMSLCESFTVLDSGDGWNDFVCVARKDGKAAVAEPIHETVASENVRIGEGAEILREVSETEYARRIAELTGRLADMTGKLEDLAGRLAAEEVRSAAALARAEAAEAALPPPRRRWFSRLPR